MCRYTLFFSVVFVALVLCACSKEKGLTGIDYRLSGAFVNARGDKLVVNTGEVERTWKLTSAGLKTVALKNIQNNKIYSNDESVVSCDWAYYGIIEDGTKASLINLSAQKSNDDYFTSDHIEVVAEFEYPEVETFVKYVIWVYPGAPGIRTQVFIKGKGAEYIDESYKQSRNTVDFNLVRGSLNDNYKATAHAALPIASSTQDEQKVEYHIKGLDKNKNYKVGFTWWDFEGSGISQDVTVTSVDGEKVFKLIENAELPDFTNDGARYETKVLNLPSDVLLDGSFRIKFEKEKGDMATVSELFIFEENGKDVTISDGFEERISELKQLAPQDTKLIGYLDCGSTISGEKLIPTGRVDIIPVKPGGFKAKFVGYFNDTQHRNKPETPLIKEIEIKVGETPVRNNWSNLVSFHKNNNGVILLKESHKCANQYGIDTGDFEITESGVANTGTSLFPGDILSDEYSWCWASWCILYEGGQDEMELAVKRFDRIRYPIDKTRDIYIQANTWGSDRGREASREDNVLKEIESQQDLGIDIQQIDDGWQSVGIRMFDEQESGEGQKATLDWHVRKDWYPEGWKNIVAESKKTGVKLGLWGAAQPITLDALKWNYDQAGFVTYKLDFADLTTHKKMDDLMTKIRSFIKYTNHKVRVNWDLTENAPRYGYYWGKEYGCVYLENRKPKVPENAIYVPSLVLRDIWQLSKYTNVNRFQTSIQNIDMVDRDLSDAYLHNHPYAVAIGLVGTPLFFQETQFYSRKAREEVKGLLGKYKKHRDAMYMQYVYPIGDEPNNASWTGFQWVDEHYTNGYLLIFRELRNNELEKLMPVRFLRNQKIMVENVITGEKQEIPVDDKGQINLILNKKADFLFLHYNLM